MPVPPPVPPEKIPEPVPFHFHGNTQEYFRIWIVNTLLTVLTCGVFLAWAKIRKRRYLRGNTTLQGHAFHYTANPWRILIGNMLVAAVFLTYSFFGAVYPVARGAAILIGLALLPWVVVKSLSFNANNTLFRGMRFRFRAGLTEAFWIYLVLPILIPFTLGFYYPAWARRKAAFKMENHRYGDAFFSFSADTGGFFRPMFFGGLIVFGGAMLLGLSVAGYVAISDDTIPNETVLGVLGLVVYGGAFFTGRHFIYPRVFNHIWNHTKLDEHCFMAQMRPGAWMKLQWVNLLAIIFTAGLAVPWATIRNTRYLVSCLHVKLTEVDALEKIDTMGSIQGSALGDSAADFVGVDFGL
ncbi:MAG: DUF898 family protein [Synoicihabitans sp.]